MLAKVNRITAGSDYRTTVRRGFRVVGAHTVCHVRLRTDDDGIRFGFIVTKAIGNAVARNRVRRRMKAVAYGLLAECAPGTDIVVRALPAVVDVPWDTLQEEISRAVGRGSTRS